MNTRNILLEKYKSIYLFLPKVGSTSIKVQLGRLMGMDKKENFPKGIHNPKIYSFPNVNFEDLNSAYQDYFRFAIVRNPWNRLVSCYKNKIRPIDYNSKEVINGVAKPLLTSSDLFYGGMPFNAFVDVVCSVPDNNANEHFRSQFFQLTDSSGNLVVNYIGKLETLRESLNDISQKTEMSFEKLSHLNKTSSIPYSDYYNDDLIEKVRDRFKADVEFFKYDFNPNLKTKPLGTISEEQKLELFRSNFMLTVLKDKNAYQKMKLKQENEKHRQSLKKRKNSKLSRSSKILTRLFGYFK